MCSAMSQMFRLPIRERSSTLPLVTGQTVTAATGTTLLSSGLGPPANFGWLVTHLSIAAHLTAGHVPSDEGAAQVLSVVSALNHFHQGCETDGTNGTEDVVRDCACNFILTGTDVLKVLADARQTNTSVVASFTVMGYEFDLR